jgi:hypothetical protein
MAARKSAKKTTTRKAAPEKAKKETGGKRKAASDESATNGKRKKAAGTRKSTPASKAAEPGKAKKKTKDKVSSMSVNLGHVFALRPRVSKTFRQADFLTARLRLQDEKYASIEEAARAVAEKALELTQQGPPKRGVGPGR